MFDSKQRDSLNWLSLFSISEKEKPQILQQIQKNQPDYDSAYFARYLLQTTMLQHHFVASESAAQLACEHVALKFMLEDTDFAKDILGSEDFGKAQSVFARKQYNSKILKQLLSCFFKLLQVCNSEEALKNLFTLPILDQIKVAWEDEVNRSFGVLKKALDKIASGVKSNCYFYANQRSNYFDTLSDPLNNYVREHFGYDFNQAKSRSAKYASTLISLQEVNKAENHLLRLAIVDNTEFWKKHENFGVVTFVNEVAEQNDIRHAEKILDHIFKNLKSIKHIDIVFENEFPLHMSMYDELSVALEEQGRRFTFKRLDGYCDTSVLDEICFCYPMSKVDETRFEIGRAVWERFIGVYNYPHEKEKVMQFLADKLESFVSENIRDHNEIGVILDCGPFRFTDKEDADRKFFRAYHPDGFTAENIWKRVYLKAHAVTLLSDDENTQFSYLQRIFVDLIKTIEQCLGICTAHQLNTSARTKAYGQLKKALHTFGIDTDDDRKEDYIISLLDRDTAMANEFERFSELEQLGDAIFGMAVAELLFYNPKTCLPWNTERKISALFEDYTRAEAQVAISKKHGFDQLFLHIGLPAKYLEFDSLYFDYDTVNEECLQILSKEKYLADSLEMIVGAVCLDKGTSTSIKFSKELLKQTFPEIFSSEVCPTEENKYNTDIEWDYWERILPSLRSVMEEEHRMLWRALDKVILTCSLGTDDKDKRKYITGSFGNTAIYGEDLLHGISWVFYDYLQNGLEFVLRKYREKIRKNHQSQH